MKILSMSVKALLVLSLCFSSFAFAQDDEGGPQTQGDDAVYGRVVVVKFKPGMRADAMQIIAEHFMPAGKKAGLPAPWAFHFQTGEWDAAFTWKLEGGMKDLEWYRSPNNIKFMEALAEQEGSMEAAEAIWAKYDSMVANSRAEVGHWHEPKNDE
ncbi:MAG: hypothetical protein OEX74_10385 [Gammaproteobacteria bacterium]|nr:hypothetical protein [Gammaproteobacteria bacterium]